MHFSFGQQTIRRISGRQSSIGGGSGHLTERTLLTRLVVRFDSSNRQLKGRTIIHVNKFKSVPST